MAKENRTAPVTVQLTPTEKAAVVAESERTGIPTSTLLRIVITEWIKTNAEKASR